MDIINSCDAAIKFTAVCAATHPEVCSSSEHQIRLRSSAFETRVAAKTTIISNFKFRTRVDQRTCGLRTGVQQRTKEMKRIIHTQEHRVIPYGERN